MAKHPTLESSSRVRWDGNAVVDKPDRYEVPIFCVKRVPKTLTADVTLRRLQQFDVKPGKKYVWKTLDADGQKVLQQGDATAGPD